VATTPSSGEITSAAWLNVIERNGYEHIITTMVDIFR